jgi:hypothetical protein
MSVRYSRAGSIRYGIISSSTMATTLPSGGVWR